MTTGSSGSGAATLHDEPAAATVPPAGGADGGRARRTLRTWAAGCALAAVLLAAVLVVRGPALLSASTTPGTVTVVFDQTVDPTEQSVAQRLQAADEFRTIARLLGDRVWLPADVTVHFGSGSGGAEYDANRHELAVPYGFVGQIRQALATERPQLSAADLDAATVQATVGVVLHETGHVLVAAYRLPVLGGEEVVADTFAAVTIRLIGDDIPGLPGDLVAYADFLQGYGDRSTSVDLFDDHLPGQLRAARIRCLVYGSDPAAHADLAASIPAADQPYCADDFTQAHDSWVAALQQYRQH